MNPDPIAIPKLTFDWAKPKRKFSFDIGGTLLGDGLQGQEFLAECKKYKTASDLPGHYRKFLAQCYRALILRPDRCDNFMWISWAPFDAARWDTLTTKEKVRESVLEHGELVFDKPKEECEDVISDELCDDVAGRLWMIILSDRQEALTLTPEHLGVIRRYDTEKGR
ncbi:hypothetical protein ACFQV2_37075 [Actinokineospora soli]|uniref:Uncharacterized protein n=1 Tax=Actinokineospora soli TaxID=1048753 RepID=A0ABW2TWE2_9PSEU